MEKCVIFGAGFDGRRALLKISEYYNILYYVDNNPALSGKKIGEISIINADELVKLCQKEPDIKIIVCTTAYKEIIEQLFKMKLKNILVSISGLIYQVDSDRVLIPYEKKQVLTYKKFKAEEKNILFVQNIPCIRTNKIARLMKDRGYKTCLLYLSAPTVNDNYREVQSIYEEIFTFFTHEAILDFINKSEFDIIHSSNTPDDITALLINSEKRIVHDCHDMLTLQGQNTLNIATFEYIANRYSAGVIYPSIGMKEIAIKKFNLKQDKVFVLENYITRELKRERRYEKLSTQDGKIHCVYEGGISGDISSNRFYEVIWKKIVESGVHIHFYSQSDEKYCEYIAGLDERIHFEGNIDSKELVNEMSRYDCGLVLYNVNENTKLYLEIATPNKMYEYINAEIPVVVSGVDMYNDFVNQHHVGIELDMDGNIKNQLEKVKSVVIEKNFLQKRGITMEAKMDKLIDFYNRVYN